MVIKRKMLLMAIHSRLVKEGYYFSARNLLQTLLGKQYSFDKEDLFFWFYAFDLDYSEWFNG